MKKTFVLTLTLCCALMFGAHVQFGKIKGLLKKDKSADTKSADKNDAGGKAVADGGDAAETSTAGLTANPKAWTANFDKSIDWFKLNPTGKLIVGASDGLYGIDAATGKTAWKHNDFKTSLKTTSTPFPTRRTLP